MKKFLWAVLIAVVAIGVTACGNTKPADQGQPKVVINSKEDLVGKRIGVQLGTTGDIYVEEIKTSATERFGKGFEAVQALQQGKIDAVVIDDQPAKVFASQNPDIKVLEDPFTVEDYAMCVSKKTPNLTKQMNDAMAELKKDGTFKQLEDYYIGKVEGAKPYESPAGIKYSGKLVMATNAEFPPYEYRDGGKIVGLDVDFARAICDKLGKELVIEDMAFDSIIAAVQSGKADFGAAGMTITEKRKKSIDFTSPYIKASQVIIVKK